MEKITHQLALLVALLTNAIVGGCSSSMGSLETRPFDIRPEFLQPSVEIASSQDSTRSYVAHHVIRRTENNEYYGIEAVLDVFGFTLQPGQISEGGIWITSRSTEDGQSSISGFSVGWHVHPGLYNDSRSRFYVWWGTRESPAKGCYNMICDGFQKTSSSLAPGDVLHPVSTINEAIRFITIRLFKDISTGDWHVHCGINSPAKPVGYFPKSLLPEMIGKPVDLRFGGYVSHDKPAPSPPMGSGYAPFKGICASVDSIKLIDADGNDNIFNDTNLVFEESRPDCYFISLLDSGMFVYGGPGCTD